LVDKQSYICNLTHTKGAPKITEKELAVLYKKVEDLRFDLNLLRVLSCVEKKQKQKQVVMPLTNEGAYEETIFLAAFLYEKVVKKMQVGFFGSDTFFLNRRSLFFLSVDLYSSTCM